MNEWSVTLYCAMWGMLFLIFLLKYRKLNVTIVCTSLYLVSSLASIYFFYNGSYDYRNLSLYPYFYVFVCILITFLPVIRYDNVPHKYIRDNEGTCRFVYWSLCFFALISIEPFLENLIHLPSVLHNLSALADFYAGRADGSKVNYEYLSWVGRKFFWINFLLKDIIPLLLFYYLIRLKRYDKRLIIGGVLAILNPIIHGFALGGRSTIVNSVFYLIFVYFLFRQYMVPKGRKLIDKILLCGIGIIGAAVAIITVVRFASDEHSVDIWTWVSLYTGEGVLNFCSDLWSLDKTSNGDNTFLMLRYVFGLTNNIDIESVRKTRDVLGIRNSVFYTYLGTIYYDFNKIGTFVFVCFFSALFCKICKVKARGVRLGQLIYLAILGKVIMMGMMFYPYTLWNDQLSLLLLLVFTWALNHKEKLAYSC